MKSKAEIIAAVFEKAKQWQEREREEEQQPRPLKGKRANPAKSHKRP